MTMKLDAIALQQQQQRSGTFSSAQHVLTQPKREFFHANRKTMNLSNRVSRSKRALASIIVQLAFCV